MIFYLKKYFNWQLMNIDLFVLFLCYVCKKIYNIYRLFCRVTRIVLFFIKFYLQFPVNHKGTKKLSLTEQSACMITNGKPLGNKVSFKMKEQNGKMKRLVYVWHIAVKFIYKISVSTLQYCSIEIKILQRMVENNTQLS